MTFFSMAVVVNQQHDGFKPFSGSKRCKRPSYTQLDYSMLEIPQADRNVANSLTRTLDATNFHRSFSTPCFSAAHKIDQEYIDGSSRVEIIAGHGAPRVCALVIEVAVAMASGIDPVPVSSGLGGAYRLRSPNGDNLAIAKPSDEEPLAVNNPKGFVGRMLGQPGLKRSIQVGETGIRELAAYLLDHGSFAGVPTTALVKISHAGFHMNKDDQESKSSSAVSCKIASLQRFVNHDFDAGELGPSGFSVTSVHRIGILDVRLLNLDRHAGNVLVKNPDSSDHSSAVVGAARLVPIDHGFCLPEWLDDPYFEWLHWPQASLPFSEAEMEYILNLDPNKDAELLRAALPSLQESSIRVLVLCTIFLKKAAAAGLLLAHIGQMMTRSSCRGEDNFSVLENLCVQAMAAISSGDIFCCDIEDDSRTDNRNHWGGEGNKDSEMFLVDKDCDEVSKDDLINSSQVLPQSSPEVAKPPKIPRFSSSSISKSELSDVAFPSPCEECEDSGDADEALGCSTTDTAVRQTGDGGGCYGNVSSGRGLLKSVSSAAPTHSFQAEGVFLGDMSDTEWESFLAIFEKLLPQAFQGIESMVGKQRCGGGGFLAGAWNQNQKQEPETKPKVKA